MRKILRRLVCLVPRTLVLGLALDRLARRVPGQWLSLARGTPRHPLRLTGRVVDLQGPPSAPFGGAFGPPVGSARMVRFRRSGPVALASRPVALVDRGRERSGRRVVLRQGRCWSCPRRLRTWADRLFGQYSRHFNLEHLWFLWYLLVFVTVAPLVVKVFSWIFLRPQLRAVDDVGRVLIRYNVVGLLLGLATLPALFDGVDSSVGRWANPIGFLARFPGFLFQYYADVPYYFSYFLAGWWLYRLRDGLSDLARTWLWNLVLGIAGFAVSQRLSNAYAMQPGTASPEWIRLVAFALYGSGAAYTTCAFIGFFQRYLDRHTRVGRYFTDMALLIYLVHLPLIPHLIWWIQPSRSSWLGASLTGMLVVTGVALVLYELFVRPTPLVYIFGPPQPRRVVPPPAPAVRAPGSRSWCPDTRKPTESKRSFAPLTPIANRSCREVGVSTRVPPLLASAVPSRRSRPALALRKENAAPFLCPKQFRTGSDGSLPEDPRFRHGLRDGPLQRRDGRQVLLPGARSWRPGKPRPGIYAIPEGFTKKDNYSVRRLQQR